MIGGYFYSNKDIKNVYHTALECIFFKSVQKVKPTVVIFPDADLSMFVIILRKKIETRNSAINIFRDFWLNIKFNFSAVSYLYDKLSGKYNFRNTWL